MKTFQIVRAKTHDNFYLPSDFISNLYEQFDSRLVKQYVEGDFVNIESDLVYYCFTREKTVLPVKEIPAVQSGRVILSFDFNVNPMCAIEIVIEGRKRFQTAEYKISNSNTRELCELIIEKLMAKYDDLSAMSFVLTGDASGNARRSTGESSDYEIIKRSFDKAGITSYLFVRGTNPPVRERVNFVNALMEKGQFFVSEKCEHSIKDRELVSWKKGSEKFIIDKSDREVSHLSDASDYGLWASKYMVQEYDDTIKNAFVMTGRREYGLVN
jgi:hypothetical protein